MAPSAKTGAAAKDRRKSDKVDKTVDKSIKSSPGLVTIKVSPAKLRALLDPASAIKEASPAKDSPAPSTILPVVSGSNAENASDSTPNTPADGTPAPQVPMGPPTEGPKKKGVKRSAAALNGNGDGAPKARGKPGPKKKQRL